MSTDNEFFQSWSRLSKQDLEIIFLILGQDEMMRLAPGLVGFLAAMARNECDHRAQLRVTPEHAGFWKSADNLQLAKCYAAAYGIRRVAIHSNTLAEWASLLLDSVCQEMAARLEASQRLAEGI